MGVIPPLLPQAKPIGANWGTGRSRGDPEVIEVRCNDECEAVEREGVSVPWHGDYEGYQR